MTGPVIPSGILVPPIAPGSAEWWQKMSASKIAAVVGLSPYTSRFALWHEMAGLIEPEPMNDTMRRGHYLEPAIAAWFADQHPDPVVSETGTWQHPTRGWQIASPDRLLTYPSGHVELLQCKSAADLDEWGPDGSDEIPPGYRAQVQWEMDTTGTQLCHVAVILPYLEFRSYPIPYDPTDAAFLVAEAQRFLDELGMGIPPSLDSHTATYQTVRRMHPLIEDTAVEVPGETVEEWLAAVVAKREADAAKRLAGAKLLNLMGNAKDAYHQGQRIAYRMAKTPEDTPYLCAVKGATSLKETA